MTEKCKSHEQHKSLNAFLRTQIRPRIAVVGSLHVDLTVKTEKMPRIGETVLSKDYKISPGGKGANQAVAAARLGANVTLIGRVGADEFGRRAVQNANENGINTSYVIQDMRQTTGIALIIVDDEGNNIIAVASGSDMRCCKRDIDKAEKVIRSSDVALFQLEIPFSVVEYAIDKAAKGGAKVILNPSPARELPAELLRKVHILTLNEKEAETLSGIVTRDLKTAKTAAERILEKGVKNVVLTIGKEGAMVATKEGTFHVEGIEIDVIDTTGAGDAFCGALAVAISSGLELKEAVLYSNCAGAFATTRIGAQEALPTRLELQNLMEKKGLV